MFQLLCGELVREEPLDDVRRGEERTSESYVFVLDDVEVDDGVEVAGGDAVEDCAGGGEFLEGKGGVGMREWGKRQKRLLTGAVLASISSLMLSVRWRKRFGSRMRSAIFMYGSAARRPSMIMYSIALAVIQSR